MNIEFKDVIALVFLVGCFIGLYLDKIPLNVFTALVAPIIGFYLGIKVGVRYGRRVERKAD